MSHNNLQKGKIRTLYSREHTTIFSRMGVFLAGPTTPSHHMVDGWRRVVVNTLLKDERLNPAMTVVSPEPESGNWADINHPNPHTQLDHVLNEQIPWELQYLNLCDITAFWLPTYWTQENSNEFSPNIGPTSRWEFGYYLQEYLKNRNGRDFIIGAPEDAESLSWAKQLTGMNGIKWHTLKKENKQELVAQSFIDEIADTLVKNDWKFNLK